MYGLVLLDCQQNVTSIADMEKGKQMTEYIVNPEEEQHLFYGRKYEELVRCKNCIKKPLCTIYRENNDDFGYCYLAERKEDETG